MSLLPEFYGDEAQLLELWLFFQEGANFTLTPLLKPSRLIDEFKESITSKSKGLCISLDRDSDPIHHRMSPYRDLPAALLAEFFVSAKATFANFPRPSRVTPSERSAAEVTEMESIGTVLGTALVSRFAGTTLETGSD